MIWDLGWKLLKISLLYGKVIDTLKPTVLCFHLCERPIVKKEQIFSDARHNEQDFGTYFSKENYISAKLRAKTDPKKGVWKGGRPPLTVCNFTPKGEEANLPWLGCLPTV